MSNALKEAIYNAKHYKAIGITELTVGKYGQIVDEPPWHLATSFKPGGTHRMDIDTSGWFKGTDPESGLQFTWSFDIEPHSANGSGSYRIDTQACENVLRQLPKDVGLEFRKYLADCADKVMKRGLEYQQYADRQYKDARTLTALAGFTADGEVKS